MGCAFATGMTFPRWEEETELLPLQDFVADSLNPNISGLLNNINQSYEPVVDQYGDQSFIFCYFI